MSSTNPGKQFEKDLKKSCQDQKVFCLRLNDTYMSYAQHNKGEFAPHNIADFIMYDGKYIYVAELKSTKYKSMSFSTDPMDKSVMIKAHQLAGLMGITEFEGVRPGLILNFRDDVNPSSNLTYWLPIGEMAKFMSTTEKKSINKLDIVQNNGILLTGELKRVHYKYDIKKLFDDISIYYKTHENTNIKEIMTEFREQQASSIEDAMDAFAGG